MKRFDTFGAYMFDLLFAPLKRGKRAANQFFIFFKVIGRIFDGRRRTPSGFGMSAMSRPRARSCFRYTDRTGTCRGLRARALKTIGPCLSMKGIISEWGGTKSGILYALTSLGYEQSTIEPFSYQDPERWAEFIVFLKGSKQSGVNNLAVIDAEVRKVKEGSSKPAYGAESGGGIEIHSKTFSGFSRYPRCGEIVCGVWPRVAQCRAPSGVRSSREQLSGLRRGRVPEGGNDRGL